MPPPYGGSGRNRTGNPRRGDIHVSDYRNRVLGRAFPRNPFGPPVVGILGFEPRILEV